MVEFWKKLGLLLGWGVPPGEPEPVVNEKPAGAAAPAAPASAWALGFDSVLPGMQGRVAVPVGPGRNLILPLKAIRVSDVFGAFQYMAQVREQWPFGSDLDEFAGYVTLEGPGWDMTVLFRKAAWRFEYYAGRTGGGSRVTGEVSWEVLVHALVLAPDYDAVVAYLALTPSRAPYVI